MTNSARRRRPAIRQSGRRRARRLFVMAALIVALSGCAASDEASPVGIGPNTDQLKRSPCACMAVRQVYPPGWLPNLAKRLGGRLGGEG